MENNNVKAIKSTSKFNVEFNGVMYSRLIDLYIYISQLSTKEELKEAMERISKNDMSLNPGDHAYHLQTILGMLSVIDKEASTQNVVEEMSKEDFEKQTRERTTKGS